MIKKSIVDTLDFSDMWETPREKEVKRRWFTAARCASPRRRERTGRAGAQQRKAVEVKTLHDNSCVPR